MLCIPYLIASEGFPHSAQYSYHSTKKLYTGSWFVTSQFLTQNKGGAMLVLSRKPGERILIGNDIAVTIVRIGPNTVRLSIDAPRDMNIVREELAHKDNPPPVGEVVGETPEAPSP